ncbi:uncharacterized protein LOC128216578 [Mya arenaria]|uniref:uncharacterized protein LOC128216578 n=1 Tax=Mya arenaria TaxID=6604 RepID=UPI0022E72D65|nr:uncharacterized protein LOC128216578 [Mya arenaria]
MTFTEYKKQQFTTSHEDTTWLDAQVGCEVEGGTTVTDENYWHAKQSPLLTFMLRNRVREIWVGKLFTLTKKECVKVNSTFFTSSKGIMVKTMQTCAIQCSEYDFFAFHRTKCYCLDDSPGVLSLERDCTYPCPGSLGELCGGPNTITLYSLDAATTCPLLGYDSNGYLTSTNANCSTTQRYICQKELCGQTYVDYYGSFSFTKSGKNECNWTISVASHVSVNVSVVMGTSLESCRNHNLSIFTPTALIADSRQSLCKSGNIKISGLGPVFIHLTTDGTKPTTVDVRWYTNTTSDSTLTTEKRDVYTSKSLIHIDTTADVSKSPKHIDTTADVRKSTIFINSTEDAGEDEQDEQSDENKIALYVPVTITSCVIVAAAIFVTICLRQKRAKKNPKRKVNENIYSYTTTEIQAQNSTPSDPKCELGEYIEVHNQSPRSAAYVIPMDQDASNQEYNTLHQRLEPTYSHPQENVYNETKKPSSVYGQYDISTVSTFTKNSSNKSQAMTDNVYNTCISRDGPCGDYDSQYDVSSASAFNKSSGKSKGQTDNVYNTFQTPDDTEYSETTFHTKEKETLPTDNEYGVVKRQT